MAVTVIGGVTLQGYGAPENCSGGHLMWQDEFDAGSDLVGMVARVSTTGAVHYQCSAQQSGRLMTLVGGEKSGKYFGLITRAEVEAVRVLAATPGAEFQITLADGREFSAMFRRDGPAISATPWRHEVPHTATDLYIPTIRLVLT